MATPLSPPALIPVREFSNNQQRTQHCAVKLPASLQVSLLTQLMVIITLTAVSLSLERYLAVSVCLVATSMLMCIAHCLATGSRVFWLGACNGSLIGLLLLACLTCVAATVSFSLAAIGGFSCLMLVQYRLALTSPAAQEFFAGTRRSSRRPLPGKRMPRTAALLLAITSILGNAHAEQIRIRSVPTGTKIYVDGEPTRVSTPQSVTLRKGQWVTLKRAGYEEHDIKITSQHLKDKKINVTLNEITEFEMLVETKTSDQKWAGSDDLTVEMRLNNSAEFAVKLSQKGKNLRRVGAIDSFKFEREAYLSKLKGIRMIATAGDDKWKCEYVSVQFVKADGSMSQVFTRRLNTWFSADAKEGIRYADINTRKIKFAYPRKPKSP